MKGDRRDARRCRSRPTRGSARGAPAASKGGAKRRSPFRRQRGATSGASLGARSGGFPSTLWRRRAGSRRARRRCVALAGSIAARGDRPSLPRAPRRSRRSGDRAPKIGGSPNGSQREPGGARHCRLSCNVFDTTFAWHVSRRLCDALRERARDASGPSPVRAAGPAGRFPGAPPPPFRRDAADGRSPLLTRARDATARRRSAPRDGPRTPNAARRPPTPTLGSRRHVKKTSRPEVAVLYLNKMLFF